LNESLSGAANLTPHTSSLAEVFKKLGSKDDMHCNTHECPLRKSAGREYEKFYDHEDTYHRSENPPKVEEHIHPLDKA